MLPSQSTPSTVALASTARPAAATRLSALATQTVAVAKPRATSCAVATFCSAKLRTGCGAPGDGPASARVAGGSASYFAGSAAYLACRSLARFIFVKWPPPFLYLVS
eukprot:852915-Prymnesium_polylepis.1